MNNNDSNDQLQPISILRRVVDMSEINAKKSKPNASNAHPRNAKKQPVLLHRKTNENKASEPLAHETQPEEESANPQEKTRQQSVRKVSRTAKTVIEPEVKVKPAMSSAQDNSDNKTRRIIAERGPVYQAKTTRLVAPPPRPQLIKQQTANTQENTSAPEEDVPSETTETPSAHEPKTKKLVLKPHHAQSSKTLKPENKTSKLNKDNLKSKPQPKRHNTELDQHQQLVQDHITDSLLLQSWRSKQWGASIATFGESFSSMLPKCMPLVQARFVNNLCIAPGRLEATVVNAITSIEIRQFTPGQWRAVTNMLSDRAIFTTSLLNGELPEGILDIFKQASLSLFPSKVRDFEYTCTCGSDAKPCEHVCALLIAFTQALEENPFNILTLRGMTIDELLSQLRDARSDQVVDEKSRYRINYEMPAQSVDFNDFYSPKGDFNEIAFHITNTPNTLIKRLGEPSAWSAPYPLEAVISPIIDKASKEAEEIGISEKYQLPLTEEEAKMMAASQEASSRAPKKAPKFIMPDLSFIATALSQEILETLTDDPVATAEDIIRWLKTKGASDIRTLARRTRLHKPTIEAFLNALCDAGLTRSEGENEKLKFEVVF